MDAGPSALATDCMRSAATTAGGSGWTTAAISSASPQHASAGMMRVAVAPSEPQDGDWVLASAVIPSAARETAVESDLIQVDTFFASVSMSEVNGASWGT